MLLRLSRNNSGMAASVIALVLLLLNTAFLVVMGSGNERMTFVKQIRDWTAKKQFQHMVDTAESIVTSDCNRLVLGNSLQPRIVSESELRERGVDISGMFMEMYAETGFEAPGGVEFLGFSTDLPAAMPADETPILVGLEAKLQAGGGRTMASFRGAERTYSLVLTMGRVDGSKFRIHSCEASDEMARCYSNSNALRYQLPVAVADADRPDPLVDLTVFDDKSTYARFKYFGHALRLPANCNQVANSVSSAIRVCLSLARQFSIFAGAPANSWSPSTNDACVSLANINEIKGASPPLAGGKI